MGSCCVTTLCYSSSLYPRAGCIQLGSCPGSWCVVGLDAIGFAWLPAILLAHQAALENQLCFGPFISSSCKGMKAHKGYTLTYIKVSCRKSEGQKKDTGQDMRCLIQTVCLGYSGNNPSSSSSVAVVGLFTVPSLTRKTSVLQMLGVGEKN